MFAILMALLNAFMSAVTVFRFFGRQITYLAKNISWAASEIGQLPDLLPDFLKPFVAVALCLAIVAIVVKLV